MSQDNDAKSVQEPVAQKLEAVKVCHSGTKFFRGKWSNKSNPIDPDTVRISVNGEVMQWQRGVMTIVPEPYLLAARDAKIIKYTQQPGVGRKVAAHIDRFPFEVDTAKPTASFEDFQKEFLSGSKKTREAVARHGLNIPIGESAPQY